MVNQQHTQDDVTTEVQVPTWSKIVEPIVAVVILWILASAACNIFA